jgi:murein L,D-transpeptidase YafK
MREAPLALAALAVALAGCAREPLAPPPAPAPGPPPLEGPEACPRIERLEVKKSARRLVAICVGGARLEIPVALSREKGPKRVRGDRRVPEGQYRIVGRARESRFHRFLPIDYPSRADAELALAQGRITPAESDAIARAHARGRLPPQDTALGGQLGFHGEGERWRGDLELDWTEGCIAVSDQVIDLLARRVPPGTPVVIDP